MIEVVNSSIVVIMYTVFQALSKSYHRGMFNNMYIAERLELHAGWHIAVFSSCKLQFSYRHRTNSFESFLCGRVSPHAKKRRAKGTRKGLGGGHRRDTSKV